MTKAGAGDKLGQRAGEYRIYPSRTEPQNGQNFPNRPHVAILRVYAWRARAVLPGEGHRLLMPLG